MQFNPGTANKEISLYEDALYWAKANSTSYPIADFCRNANFGLDRVTSLIKKNDNTWQWQDNNDTDQTIAYHTLEAGEDEYLLTKVHTRLLRVRVKDVNGNYKTLDSIDRRQASDSELAATGEPTHYDKRGKLLRLIPTPDYGYAQGIEMEYQRSGDRFAVGDTTKEPGFDSEYHRLISLYAALDYCEANLKDKQARKIEKRIKELETDLADDYSSRDRDKPKNIGVEEDDYGASALM